MMRPICKCCGEPISDGAWDFVKWLRAYSDKHAFDESKWENVPKIHQVAIQAEARRRSFHLGNDGTLTEVFKH